MSSCWGTGSVGTALWPPRLSSLEASVRPQSGSLGQRRQVCWSGEPRSLLLAVCSGVAEREEEKEYPVCVRSSSSSLRCSTPPSSG